MLWPPHCVCFGGVNIVLQFKLPVISGLFIAKSGKKNEVCTIAMHIFIHFICSTNYVKYMDILTKYELMRFFFNLPNKIMCYFLNFAVTN